MAISINAREIEAQLQRAQERMQEKKYEDMKNKMMQNATHHSPYINAIGGLANLGQQAKMVFIFFFDFNIMFEMQMPLEVAYNMWLVRFGDMWVKSEDVQDADGFRWPLVASRLRDMRLLEVTTVSNHHRLVPHVWK